jgi:hypothetical protein
VAWQDNSSGKVKFRSGSYETTTSVDEAGRLPLMTVFPNPVSDILHLGKEVTFLKIISVSGREVLMGKGNRVDVSSLPAGIYFISTETGWGKFVKS